MHVQPSSPTLPYDEYDPFDPYCHANPHEYLRYLRDNDPVYEVKNRGFWILTRYDDVLAAVKDIETFSSAGMMKTLMGEFEIVPECPFFMSLDPPEHTRYRGLVNDTFNPRLLRTFEPNALEIVEELLDHLEGMDEVDLVQEFTNPLPVNVISDVVGVPRSDQLMFRDWMNSIIESQNWPFATEAPTEDQKEHMRGVIKDFRQYFVDQIAEVRKRPREDFISNLVKKSDTEGTLSDLEMISTLTIVLLGGSETTFKLIGSMFLALLKHPDQLEELRNDSSLVSGAVEEAVRYDGPALMLPRYTAQDAVVSGTKIPAGVPVFLGFGSANRDERKFSNPDVYDIHRDTTGHLGFGLGHHYCLGAPLARIEAKLAVEGMLKRFSKIELIESGVVRDQSWYIRGLSNMPVKLYPK